MMANSASLQGVLVAVERDGQAVALAHQLERLDVGDGIPDVEGILEPDAGPPPDVQHRRGLLLAAHRVHFQDELVCRQVGELLPEYLVQTARWSPGPLALKSSMVLAPSGIFISSIREISWA